MGNRVRDPKLVVVVEHVRIAVLIRRGAIFVSHVRNRRDAIVMSPHYRDRRPFPDPVTVAPGGRYWHPGFSLTTVVEDITKLTGNLVTVGLSLAASALVTPTASAREAP